MAKDSSDKIKYAWNEQNVNAMFNIFNTFCDLLYSLLEYSCATLPEIGSSNDGYSKSTLQRIQKQFAKLVIWIWNMTKDNLDITNNI